MTTRSKFLGSLLVPVATVLVLGAGAPAQADVPETHAPGAIISDGGPKLPSAHGKKPAKKTQGKSRIVRRNSAVWVR